MWTLTSALKLLNMGRLAFAAPRNTGVEILKHLIVSYATDMRIDVFHPGMGILNTCNTHTGM